MVVIVTIVGFAAVHLTASAFDPDAYSEPLDHLGALYFSMTSATTIGYGDIAARSDPARVIVMVQMVVNVVVLGLGVRLIVRVAGRRRPAQS